MGNAPVATGEDFAVDAADALHPAGLGLRPVRRLVCCSRCGRGSSGRGRSLACCTAPADAHVCVAVQQRGLRRTRRLLLKPQQGLLQLSICIAFLLQLRAHEVPLRIEYLHKESP